MSIWRIHSCLKRDPPKITGRELFRDGKAEMLIRECTEAELSPEDRGGNN